MDFKKNIPKKLLGLFFFALMIGHAEANPSTQKISEVLDRSKNNTLKDCYYLNKLYNESESVEEVYELSKILLAELSHTDHQKRNRIATARRLSALGQHKQALKVLLPIRSNTFHSLDATIRSEYYYTIGYIALNSGNPKIALDYYIKASKISATTDNTLLYQYHLCAIGIAYNANQNPTKALEYFNNAKKLETQGENRNSLYLQLNLALTELNLGNLNAAKSMFIEAFPLIKARNDVYAEIRTLGNLGEIYAKQDSTDLAIVYFSRAQEMALSNNQSLDLIRINTGLSDAYEKAGNTEEALRLLKSVSKIESDLNEGVSESLTALELKNEIQGQKKINSDIREQRNREIELTQYLTLTVIILVILLVALITYIFLFRKKKQHLLRKELTTTKRSVKSDDVQFHEIISKLEKIILIEELYKQSGITLDQVAKRIGTNRSYLSEAINSHYQKTFSAWLNSHRIEAAKSLLADSKCAHLSIEGIAKTAGFTSISTFNSHFKTETGLTPSYFRKNSVNQ